jgi:DNA-binding transcriptional MerR regulator
MMDRSPPLTIGRLSRMTGCKIPTIRYYEQINLLPKPDRSEGNQRIYRSSHVQRLAFIRHARELGFGLEDIRDLLSLSDQPDAACARVDGIAKRHLVSVRDRITRLKLLETELERMVTQCAGHVVADCRVIEVLSNHGKCLSPDHGPSAQAQGKAE